MLRPAFCIPALAALAFAQTCAAHEDVPTSLPVGDGKVTGKPEAGNVFACNTRFRGGGARHVGDWFKGDTWNPLEKPHVQGEVYWSDAKFAISEGSQSLTVEGNGLPVNQPTGEFPISPGDPAYRYDTNPNPIRALDLSFDIPREPTPAQEPGCLPMGMIGFTLTGVAFYNALDDAGRDAAAHEVQDLCDGHPQGKGQYHYHSASPCLPGEDSDAIVGWALDGYPIKGMRDSGGHLLTDADLDECHGRVETTVVGDRTYGYAYRLTAEYPYVMGCYRGQVMSETRRAIRATMGPPRQRGRRGQSPGGD